MSGLQCGRGVVRDRRPNRRVLAPLHFAGCVRNPQESCAKRMGRGDMPGLYFEEFEVGQHFRHAVHRTVTETDNVLFSTLTMNPAALHLDAEYCKTTPYGQPIVNSVFTLGLLVGLSIYDTTFGTTLGNLGWEEVKFPRPVLVGDTLRAQTTVVAKRASQSRQDSGILTFEHRAYNQRNEEVASCKRAALMMKKPAP
jgi:acyl dehydratase